MPRELHAKAAKQGLLGVAFPEEVGGSGRRPARQRRAAGGLLRGRRVQRADGGAVHRRHRAAPHLRASGERRPGRPVRPADAGRRADRLARGHRAGRRLRRRRHPHHGPVATATHYVVNGAKTFITSGVRADFVTTAVRTGGAGPRRDLAARRREGHARLHRRPRADQDGLALLRHRRAVVRRLPGAGRQPGRRGEHRASTRSPSSSSSSGSRWRSTATASPPAAWS